MCPSGLGFFVRIWLALVMSVSIAACSDGSDPSPPLPPEEEVGEDAVGDGSGNGGLNTDTEPTVVECSDGTDNDGDGLIDWQLDLGCTGPHDPTEGGLHDELDEGWTVFEAGPNTTIYYVSSSAGDDSGRGWHRSGTAPIDPSRLPPPPSS